MAAPRLIKGGLMEQMVASSPLALPDDMFQSPPTPPDPFGVGQFLGFGGPPVTPEAKTPPWIRLKPPTPTAMDIDTTVITIQTDGDQSGMLAELFTKAPAKGLPPSEQDWSSESYLLQLLEDTNAGGGSTVLPLEQHGFGGMGKTTFPSFPAVPPTPPNFGGVGAGAGASASGSMMDMDIAPAAWLEPIPLPEGLARPLRNPDGGKWAPWVLELSATDRTQLFVSYQLPEDTVDTSGLTIKAASRRMKQNRAQRAYLARNRALEKTFA
jgi:hypothetical protein